MSATSRAAATARTGARPGELCEDGAGFGHSDSLNLVRVSLFEGSYLCLKDPTFRVQQRGHK